MKRIEVTLNVSVVAPLLDLIRSVADRLKTETAFAPDMPEKDVDLEGLWREGLIHTQVEDCAKLMGMFDSEFLDTGKIAFTRENADPILRASSAVRLKLRAGVLGGLADEMLEEGAIDIEALTRDQQNGFRAYLFMATVQEIIIKHLGE